IIDATFVTVPKQRNTREENKIIKEGAVPIDWRQNPRKLVTAWEVTSAEVHNSQVLEEVLQPPEVGGADVYADSAYRSLAREESLTATGHTSRIHEKGTRNHPLTDAQKSSNKEKSRVRARVEHVFGSMTNEMGGIAIRTIGLMRAKVQIGLLNLVYNIKRVATLIRKKYFGFDRVVAPRIA
ncbi:Transposase DDE domain-containing protein, partial [Nitrosomonas sp. Nm51]|uniref:transposase n=1 Tax=Nitrosomonas sp. Nm51 TaxID=133720 RepID=UPI0008B5E602